MKKNDKNRIIHNIKGLLSPLNERTSCLIGDLVPPYKEIKSSNMPISQIWGGLGLKNEFIQMFPGPNSFWDSEKSFFEVYEELKHNKESGE